MVLVSILGEFDSNVLPLFFHYSEELRLHILISDMSKTDKAHAQRVQRGLKRFCQYYELSQQLLYMDYDEDKQESIENLFFKIEQYHNSGERLALNYTDALASTQAIMQPLLAKLNGEVFAYDRFDNTCNIVKNGKIYQEVISPMTIKEHLMLKNLEYEITSEKELAFRKEIVLTLMTDSEHYNNFKNSYVQKKPLYDFKNILALLKKIGKENDQFYITGALFEEYCYWLIQGLGFDDIQLGTIVHFGHKEDKTFKNEFDLLCIKDNHLNIIECKFRNFVNGEDIVYKYDSVIDLLDADGKVMIVAVGGDETHQKFGRQFRDATKYRANENNIEIYQAKVLDPQKFRDHIQKYFNATL